jgi:hypothetical protein
MAAEAVKRGGHEVVGETGFQKRSNEENGDERKRKPRIHTEYTEKA